MPPRLRDEIKQSKPFKSLEQEAMLSIARTDSVLGYSIVEALKPFGVTPTQYNVLRILRGARPNGLCREDIRTRLVAQVPDVTRLLDRMEQAGLVGRQRDSADRRLVTTKITAEGLRLLERLDSPLEQAHRQQLGHMNRKELQSLISLLAKARQKED
jgi:MarR family 2-MHQ and catechol resistance regulon transcriptional repressor